MATTTLLLPYPVSLPSPSVRYLCQSLWSCYSTSYHTWRRRGDLLLATGQAYSVVPPTARHDMSLDVMPEPGWRGQIPTWFGTPCRIGRVTLWLPIQAGQTPYREFSLLVLLPRDDPEDAPPFIHLGAQFLVEYQAHVFLDGAPGRLVIP